MGMVVKAGENGVLIEDVVIDVEVVNICNAKKPFCAGNVFGAKMRLTHLLRSVCS